MAQRRTRYPNGYFATGVTFEPEVIDYVRQLADEEERAQSTVINRIIREHAERHGTPLLRKRRPEEEKQAA